VEITPDLAREWLKRNTRNRRLDRNRVNVLSGAMKRGEWHENGDAIRFSVSGTLLDGQTRVAAVVDSGVTIRSLVAENLPDEAQITIDVGAKRSFAAVLQIQGVKDQAALAAVARKIFDWETGQLRNTARPPTHAQLQTVVDNHEESMRESLRIAQAIRRQLPVPTTVIALAHWIFNQIDADDTEFFFARLRDGQGLVEGDPVFALRKVILLDATRTPRYRQAHVLALVIKAWNFYRAGDQIKLLQWRSGGSSPESFPQPK
jgi:hypothetical protein